MNQRNLLLLDLAIASMLMLNWFQSNKEAEGQHDLLLPGLKENLAYLDRVEIETFDESFSLVRKEEGWVLIEKDSYPVDFPILSKLLNSLSGARLIEMKTSKPENFARLHLDDVSNEKGDSILVSGFAPGFEFSVVVGKQALNRQGQFIRMSGIDQAWLIDKELEVSADMVSWLDPVIINIENEQVSRIEQYDSSGVLSFEIERADIGKAEETSPFNLKDIPPGRSLKYPSITDELKRSLVNVRFIDVSPHEPSRWESPTRMTFSLKDGAVVDVTAEKIDEKSWLHLLISDKRKDRNPVALWDYEVSSYVYEDYDKEMEDLLEAEPE